MSRPLASIAGALAASLALATACGGARPTTVALPDPAAAPLPSASSKPSASARAPLAPPAASIREVVCQTSIASSRDAQRVATVFFTLAAGEPPVRTGSWFLCHGLATDPTTPCLAVDGDASPIEARCPAASSSPGRCDGKAPCFWCDDATPEASELCWDTPRDCQMSSDGRPCTPRAHAECSATGAEVDGRPVWSYSCHATREACEAGRRISVPTRGRRAIARMPVSPCVTHPGQ